MDYCYLGDTMQLRPYMMRDYEALPLGSLEKCTNNSNKQKTNYYCQEKSSKSKKNCQLCQEKKKKPLTSYIKQRNNTQRFNSICEEEDEKPETPNQQTQQNEQQASKK